MCPGPSLLSLTRSLTHSLPHPCAALDTATERALYLHLQQHSSCYISIAHRKQLAAFHSHVLEASGDGAWALLPAAEFLERLPREERGGG